MAARNLSNEDITRIIANNLVKQIKKFYTKNVEGNNTLTFVFDYVYNDEDLIIISLKLSTCLEKKFEEVVKSSLSKDKVEKLLPHFHNEFRLTYNIDKFGTQTRNEVWIDLVTINVFVTKS